MSNQYYIFGTRTTFIRAGLKIFCRVNGAYLSEGIFPPCSPKGSKLPWHFPLNCEKFSGAILVGGQTRLRYTANVWDFVRL